MSERVTVKHVDEFEHPWPNWILCRKGLGLSAFGMNIAELAPGQQIPEHDEVARDQEEVFVTLSGAPTIVVDGEPFPAPEGTFVRLDPEPRRFARNDGEGIARVLILSAPRSSGYEPMDWA
ncbi:MAG: cupin domain-containing protein [Gaiellales bacterium]